MPLEPTVFGKKLEFAPHAILRFQERGTNQAEVEHSLEKGKWTPAKLGRQETKFTFPCKKEWKDVWYATKTVNPVFVVEEDKITVITAYVFYGGKAAKK